ncbi:YidC/Oxa1 family membrane protein insertase [Elusimicrobium simillimum]|uniref:membrane protein insertase YidC n=1 Tax=Elusimicrobium simillimum TaxID=3143438 RepID=UPI003C6FF78B
MDNKKFMVPFLVFFIALMAYNQFVALPKAQKLQAEKAAATAALEEAQTQTTAQSVTSAGIITSNVIKDVKTSDKEELYSFSTATADIVFTSKGAGIKDFVFKDCVGDVNLTPYTGESFYTTFPGLNFKETSKTANSITFAANINNVTVSKIYTFNENGINNLQLIFNNNNNKEVAIDQFYFNFGPGLGTVESEKSDNGREMKAVYSVQQPGKSLKVINRGKEDLEDSVQDGNWLWAGLTNRYFLAVIMPKNWKSGILEYDIKPVDKVKRFFGILGTSKVEGPLLKIDVPAMVLAAKSKTVLDSDFYFGPKDYKEFEKLPYQLDRSIDFGFFGTLGKMVRSLLVTLYKYTGNYGFSIIIVAILFQAIMLKFTIMQQKSTLTMKKVQPEMKRIQEQYKNDQAAQQQALMALYKKHNFNPFMGCLPLLIQMPIFLALFNAFRTSWDLHGATFIFWIKDLSAKDPYYVLPIVMGAIMFFQQKISAPTGGDPTQTAMLKWMPVIFTFVFINFPAGLVLYWLTNSIISLVIQLIINKRAEKAA